MLLERREDRIDNIAVRSCAAADMDMRLGVKTMALLGQAGECLRPVSRLEQRAIISARSALGEDVYRSVEPDGDCTLVQQLACSRVVECPAAGCDYANVPFDQGVGDLLRGS